MTQIAYRGGSHRAIPPAETLARVMPYLPVMGITRIADVTGLDVIGIPVVMVVRPNARSIAVSQGKGIDTTAARVSGLMESIEAYHAETITLPLKLASYEELRYNHHLADVTGLPRSAELRFHPHRQLLWIEGHELLSNNKLWLPYELVHANYTLPFPPGSGCFAATTNGLASGNDFIEAVIHALCELVERDAVTLWKLGMTSDAAIPGLAPESIDDPACNEILALYATARVTVKIWSIGTLGLPVFFCAIIGEFGESDHPAVGAGCHPAPEIALLRALTEAAQVRTSYIAGSRDDLPAEAYQASVKDQTRRLLQTLMAGHRPLQSFAELPACRARTLEDELAEILRCLRAAGFAQVMVVDLTKPEFGISVVRAVVPGLEGAFEGAGSDYVPGARGRALLAS